MTKPTRGPKGPSVVLLICAAVAVVLSCFIFASKTNAQDTSAKPPERAKAALALRIGAPASSAPAPVLAPAPAVAAAAAEGKKTAPSDAAERLPIDSAIVGPSGGVPTHTTGRLHSPFGDPEAKTPVNVRVGILLASVRQYDIKEGTFEADFFLSLTSDRPMPKMDLEFANGREDQSTSARKS